MYKRSLTSEIEQLAKEYPVVTITGPRQSGKTTLVKEVFPKKPYANLEAPDTREFALSDPRGFLADFPEGAVLDEIQRAPELFSYIQVIVDETGQKGQFILTGSHQMELHQAIAQSLAGRTALLTLLPMSLSELTAAGIELDLDDTLLKGGYPRVYMDNLNPTKAYRNYFQTYIERDLRQLIRVKDLTQFQRFIRILAGRIGQLCNFGSLSNDVGVSSNTIKEWISILEASFVVFRLHPYYENFGKRIIKAPKLYFTDVGLATYLLGIENANQISRDPLRGNLIENLVVLELMKNRLNRGLDPQIYYFRDAHGHEVDFIFQNGRALVPIEVKASRTFNRDFLKQLTYFQKLAGDRCEEGYLVYTGDREQTITPFKVINYRNLDALECFKE